MIPLTRRDGRPFVVSAHQIETIETTPDTVITLVSGRKHLVTESADEVVSRATAFFRRIFREGPVSQEPEKPVDEKEE